MTTTEGQYVPSEKCVRHRYVSAMAYAHDTPEWQGGAEFDRFLARVRRDAKTEAWGECASALIAKARELTTDDPGPGASEAEWADWRGWYYTWCAAVQHRTTNPYRQEQS